MNRLPVFHWRPSVFRREVRASRYFPSHMAQIHLVRDRAARITWRPSKHRTASAAEISVRTAPPSSQANLYLSNLRENNPRTEDSCFGRQRSTPAPAKNVAAASLLNRRFHQFRWRAAGTHVPHFVQTQIG